MRAYLLVALLGALTGCSQHHYPHPEAQHYFVRFEEGLSHDQRGALRKAAAEWQEVTRDTVVFDFVRSGSIRFYGITSSDKRLVETDNGVKRLGWVHGPDVYFVTDRLKDESMFYCVALHELGHVIGVRHTPGGVMNEETDERFHPDHLQESDISAYWDTWSRR